MSSDDDQDADIIEAEPDDQRVWTEERRQIVDEYRAHTAITAANSREVRILWRLLNPRDDDEYRVTMRSLQRYIAHHWP